MSATGGHRALPLELDQGPLCARTGHPACALCAYSYCVKRHDALETSRPRDGLAHFAVVVKGLRASTYVASVNALRPAHL